MVQPMNRRRYFEDGAILCSTFLWSPFTAAVELQQVVEVVKTNVGRYPDLVVVNQGLHHIKSGTENTEEFILTNLQQVYDIGAEIARQAPDTKLSYGKTPLIIFQELTSLNYIYVSNRYPTLVHRFNDRFVQEYNNILRAKLSSMRCDPPVVEALDAPTLAFVSAYALSAPVPPENRSTDGIHFMPAFSRYLNYLYLDLFMSSEDMTACVP